MIQIQEKDAFWRFYKRYYINQAIPPEPSNLCNYFWKSVGGAFKMFFWDTNCLVTTGLFTALTLLTYWCLSLTGILEYAPTTLLEGFLNCMAVIFYVVVITFFGFCAVLAPTFRFFDYWSKKDERVCMVAGAVIVTLGFGLIISMAFTGKDGPWHWRYLLYAIGIEFLVSSVIVALFLAWHFFFSDHTNLGRNILQFLGSLKSRACPLVVPPQSYKDAQREAKMNCSDG